MTIRKVCQPVKVEFNGVKEASLPPYTAIEDATQETLVARVSPTSCSNSVVYSLQPPDAPGSIQQRAPCDIVLVIDVSSSMGFAAPLPDVDKNSHETAGLSVLDLVKHAALTVVETLGQGDRLALVTFAYGAQVRFALQQNEQD